MKNVNLHAIPLFQSDLAVLYYLLWLLSVLLKLHCMRKLYNSDALNVMSQLLIFIKISNKHGLKKKKYDDMS